MQLSTDQILYLRGGLGRLHRITAIFIDAPTANAYLSSNPTQSVLAAFDSFTFVAASADLGFLLPSPAAISTIRSLIESARIFLAEGDVAANRVEADNRLAQSLAALNASYPLPIPSSAI
jgi:hypothetical protein